VNSPTLALTWHFARRSGRRGAQAQVLAAAAAAISALVLLVLLAAWMGAGTRADRTAWLTPAPDRNGTAVQALSSTYAHGETIIVVNLAQLPGRAAAPVPPGLPSFPKPGQVYLSPALADLILKVPTNQLAERFPKTSSYRMLGDDALASPEQLLAVIGRTADDPEVSVEGQGDDNSGLIDRAVVSGYSGTKVHPLTEYDWSGMLLAAGLLVVPVLALAAAAGRLGAARREQRLAALRLAGATPRQILAMTGIESAAVGAGGAIVGVLAYAMLLPALAHLPYGIGTWYAGDLWVGVPGVLAAVVGMALLTAASAVSALRQVANSPLGVAQESNPRRTGLIRLGVFLVLVLYIATTAGGGLKPSQMIALLILFYGAVWIIGPWVVDRLGRILGRFARRPATLLAARRLSSDPHGAWRTVSGLVLAGFVAGFFTVAQLNSGGFLGLPDQVAVSLPDSEQHPAALQKAADRARVLLTDAGLTVTVHSHTGAKTDDPDSLLLGGAGLTVDVHGGRPRLDAVVTALTPLAGSSAVFTDKDLMSGDEIAVAELRSVGLATLAISFLIASASAGLTAAANVLDRRRIYARLRLTGTPLSVLNKARVRETVIPLVVLAGSVTACGVYLAMKLNQAVGAVNSAGILQLAVCTLIGAATVFAAIGVSRPLLAAVTENPVQQPD
jgi:hypothetical protein